MDFNYLKSNDVFKLKVLTHASLSILDKMIESFLLDSKENPLMEIFSKLELNVKEVLVKYNEEKKNFKTIIKD